MDFRSGPERLENLCSLSERTPSRKPRGESEKKKRMHDADLAAADLQTADLQTADPEGVVTSACQTALQAFATSAAWRTRLSVEHVQHCNTQQIKGSKAHKSKAQ